jgi:hypothetical protein
MAENTFALIKYLTSPASPLPGLASGYASPRTIFFAYLGLFFVYSFRTAEVLYSLLFIASCVLIKTAGGTTTKKTMVKAMFAVTVGALGALIGANAVAFVMQRILGRGMSWFKGEFEPLLLYGPAAMCGTCFYSSVGFLATMGMFVFEHDATLVPPPQAAYFLSLHYPELITHANQYV